MLELNFLNKTNTISNRNNQQNILQLTKLITQQKNNHEMLSTLFTNRGVLYYQLGNTSLTTIPNSGHTSSNINSQWAQADFQKALQHNHLNLVAYYNLFSLAYHDGHLLESLKNLCCALSCLYLIRGRLYGNQSDVSKCVRLAENNCEGRLLKALQYTKKGKYALALNQIKWILDVQPRNKKIVHIRKYLEKQIKNENKNKNKGNTRYNYDNDNKQDQYQQQDENLISNQNQHQNNSSVQPSSTSQKRLTCTLYPQNQQQQQSQQFDINSQLNAKFQQFNQVFNSLYNSSVTQHIGSNGGSIFLLRDSLEKVIREIKGKDKQKQFENFQDKFGEKQRRQSKQAKRLFSFDPQFSPQAQQNNQDQNQPDRVQNSYQITQSPPKKSKLPSEAQQFTNNRYNSSDIKLLRNNQFSHISGGIFDQATLTESNNIQSIGSAQDNNGQNVGQVDQYGLENYFNSQSSKKASNISREREKNWGKKSSAMSNSGYQNSFLTVRAQDDDKKLNIKVQQIQINQQLSPDFQLNNLYCTFCYGQPKIILIKSTPLQKQQLQQKKSFVQQQPKRLLIKVFNKQLLQFKDRFVGEGEIEVVGGGMYTVPVYEKSEKEGTVRGVGKVVVNVIFGGKDGDEDHSQELHGEDGDSGLKSKRKESQEDRDKYNDQNQYEQNESDINQ